MLRSSVLEGVKIGQMGLIEMDTLLGKVKPEASCLPVNNLM